MITLENYLEQSRNIDFDTLPVALKNGDKLTRGAAPNNWSAYNSNENIKRVINAYLEKLNEYIEKNPLEKPQKSAPVPKKEKAEAKPRPAKRAEPETQPEEEAEAVEKILPEIAFIKRYVAMHGKTKTQDEVLRFVSSLQKAILEKRIRKTSKYASEIQHIQNQLVKCYEKMGASIAITIDKKTLEKYTAIAGSQKTMLSVTYIKQYISLHGRKDVKDKAKALMEKIRKAAESQ